MNGPSHAKSRTQRRARRVSAPRPELLEPRQLLAIFTVTGINDTGAGSLRDALIQANQTLGADTINFNISGTGPQTISLVSPLPQITDVVTIDGTSQPGYDPANPKPMIALDGAAAGSSSVGLNFAKGSGGTGAGQGSFVRALAIDNFGSAGIALADNGFTITGCFIGVDLTGALDAGNRGIGIRLDTSSNNQIGGATDVERNVISGNSSYGIQVNGLTPSSSTANRFIGNYIGTDSTGTVGIPNDRDGIFFFGFMEGNTVGGTAPARGT